jgi:hypothetical protein
MASQARVADTPGYAPLTIDVALKKGVVITGRVIDGATRRPLPGYVMVSALLHNPFAKEYPEFSSAASFHSESTDANGSFRIVTIPGPVILMGGPDTPRMPEGEMARLRFKPPVPDPKFPKYFAKRNGYEGLFYGLGGGISHVQGNSCKVLVLEPGAGVVKQDVVLEPAAALPVKIVDGAGRPLGGTWVTGISPQEWHYPIKVAKDACSAYHLEPGKPRLLVFYEPGKKLMGLLRLKGDEKEPAVARLGPAGSVRGRLLGEGGKPLAGVTVRLYHRERPAEEIHRHAHRSRVIETDADGRFLIDEVVPGVKFGLSFSRGRRSFDPAEKVDRVAPAGKPLDLEDVKVKPENKGG